MATKGYAAVEVGQAFRRARTLCQQLGDPPQLVLVLRGLWGFYLIGGQIQCSRQIAEQFVRLANEAGKPALQMGAHSCQFCPDEMRIVLLDEMNARPKVNYFQIR